MENLAKQPAKGILKNASSLERQNSNDKDIKWDEINILQTLHPPDKDYGHMKIEEPKTPYSYYCEDEDGEAHSDTETPIEIDPDNLAELINRSKAKSRSIDEEEENKAKSKSSLFNITTEDDDDDGDDDLEGLTDEEKVKRQDFEVKRKKHYNEYQMVKLARKLLQDELDEVDEEDGDSGNKPDSTDQSNAGNSSS